MKHALLACCVAAVIGLSGCSRDTDLAEVSDTTDTTVAPGAATSTDPEAAMDEARRSTDPYASGTAQSGANTMTPAQGGGTDPANTLSGGNNQTTGTGTGAELGAGAAGAGAGAGTTPTPTASNAGGAAPAEGNNESAAPADASGGVSTPPTR